MVLLTSGIVDEGRDRKLSVRLSTAITPSGGLAWNLAGRDGDRVDGTLLGPEESGAVGPSRGRRPATSAPFARRRSAGAGCVGGHGSSELDSGREHLRAGVHQPLREFKCLLERGDAWSL
jgi:hypothetical protein